MSKTGMVSRITGKILPVLTCARECVFSGNHPKRGADTRPNKYRSRTKLVLNKYLLGLFLVSVCGGGPADASAYNCYQWPLRESKGSYAYDGDTIYIQMPGLPDPIARMSVRVAGIDTPELRGACEAEKSAAIAARNRVRALLDQADLTNTPVQFCNPEWGRYGGRVVAWVAIGNIWLHDLLIGDGVARPYDGGKRGGWCNVSE
jgi:endonuclease YncB( thermonuclease family)